ncbi:hypothetical protein [Streptomyces sp. NPDC048644]|uniref:hypothetical protein n=1 Tax=Streptomyces sp. NPDC048644 TaxID=3365582 RepID=UPI0037172311
MRVYAAYEPDGRIVALAEISESSADGEPTMRILPYEQQKVAELEVPQGFEERPLAEIAAQYTVDSSSGEARLVPSS